jgi:hypothetical protein
MKAFLALMALELAQNVPLITGFVVAWHFWREGQWATALGWMIAGGVLAALVIWVTEPRIFAGHRESWRAVAGNALIFPLLMVLLALYLSAAWSSWTTDLLVGGGLAVLLAAGQELASREHFGATRAVWLAVSGAGTLLLFRLLLNSQPVWCVVAVNVWFTLVMGLYKHWRLRLAAN